MPAKKAATTPTPTQQKAATTPTPTQQKAFARGRFATRRSKIVLGGCLVLLLGFTYGSVELTSVPGFCRSCHEIKIAHDSWARSPHAKIRGKTRATCRDCHVPSWKRPWAVLWFKLSHGAKDTYHHFAGNERHDDPEFYFGLKQKTMSDMPNEICLSCHADILRDKDVIRTAEWGEIRGLHRSEEASKLPCTMCHKNTGHDMYD